MDSLLLHPLAAPAASPPRCRRSCHPTTPAQPFTSLRAPARSNWDAYGWFEGRVAQVDFGRDLLAPEEDPNEDINPNALYLNIQ